MMRNILLSIILILAPLCDLRAQRMTLTGAGLGAAAGAPPPTVSFVNGCVGNASSLTTNCTLTWTSGNLLVAASKTENTSGTAAPVFTSTSGANCPWVRAMPPTAIATGSGFNSTMYTCILAGSGSQTVTITWSGTTGANFTDLSVSQWSTTSTWNNPVLDRAINNSNTTSTTSCPTGTTGLATQNANDLLIAVCQNFNNAQTWGALTGWTNRATSSRNTLGLYSKAVTSTGTQSTTVPLSAADQSQGMLIALQASNSISGVNGTLIQADNSAGQTGQFDHIALSGVVPGDTLVYYVFHNNWSGTGTTAMSDSNSNIWFPCNTNTGGSTSVTMTDLQFNSTFGMSCFYSIAVTQGGTVTGNPTASDCSVSCSFVGGVFMEFSGLLGWDAFSNTSNGVTSTTSPNNVNCGSLTTTATNDYIICGIDTASGTPTAGTVPLTFPAVFNTTNGSMEAGVWSSSGTTSPTQSLASSGVAYGGMAVAFK